MSKYADINKSAKDLTTKSFNYTKKVEFKTAAGGVGYTAEAVLGKPTTLSLKGEAAVGDLKIDSLKIGSDDKIALELSNSAAVKGAKLTFKGTDASRVAGAAAVTAAAGVEYKSGANVFTLDADLLETATLPVKATALFNYDGFLLGAEVGVQALKGSVTDYNVAAGYKGKSTAVAVQTAKKLSTATATIYQVVNPELTVAGVASFPVKGAGKVDVTAAAAYKLSADATATFKASSTGKVAVSFAHVLSPLATLTLASEVDAANLASDDHKFGLNLALKA